MFLCCREYKQMYQPVDRQISRSKTWLRLGCRPFIIGDKSPLALIVVANIFRYVSFSFENSAFGRSDATCLIVKVWLAAAALMRRSLSGAVLVLDCKGRRAYWRSDNPTRHVDKSGHYSIKSTSEKHLSLKTCQPSPSSFWTPSCPSFRTKQYWKPLYRWQETDPNTRIIMLCTALLSCSLHPQKHVLCIRM